MHRILYISTLRAPLDSEELDELLAKSRRNNAAAGVTGLLVLGGRRFLQLLEGEKAVVDRTYERIARDPRHFALVKLNDKPVDARAFGKWSMGFERGGDGADAASLDAQLADLVGGIADPNLRAYFAGFVKNHSSS